MLYIYKFTNWHNGKIYIGSTIDIDKRIKAHKKDSKSLDYKFYRAIRKYGWSSFLFQVVEECCPLFRNERENYWIDYWHTLDSNFGYNSMKADAQIPTEEVVQKRIKTLTGQKRTWEQSRNLAMGRKDYPSGLYDNCKTEQEFREAQRRHKNEQCNKNRRKRREEGRIDRDKIRDRSQNYYAKNKEEISKREKIRRESNQETTKLKNKVRYAKEKDKSKERSKQYYLKNKERIKEQTRKYANEHKEEIKARKLEKLKCQKTKELTDI